jgi:hypothetical protein
VFVVEEGPLGNPPHPKGQRVTWRFSIGIGGAFGMEYAPRETVDPMNRNRAGLGAERAHTRYPRTRRGKTWQTGGGDTMPTSEHNMSRQEGFEPGDVRGALIIMMTMMVLVGLVIGDLAQVGIPPTPLTQPSVTRLAPGLVGRFSGPALHRPHRVPQGVTSVPMIMGALQILAGSRVR